MVALLFALCLLALVALTLFALHVAGILIAVLTGLSVLNLSAVILGAIVKRRRPRAESLGETTPAPAATPRESITGRQEQSPHVSRSSVDELAYDPLVEPLAALPTRDVAAGRLHRR